MCEEYPTALLMPTAGTTQEDLNAHAMTGLKGMVDNVMVRHWDESVYRVDLNESWRGGALGDRHLFWLMKYVWGNWTVERNAN